MKLESQVTSFELSKRLDELGVKQKSLVSWQVGFDGIPTLNISFTGEINWDDYPAYTVAELGEMLPDWTETAKRAADDWVCIVRHKNDDINDHSFGKTEADARAKMLIYLLENGLIKND